MMADEEKKEISGETGRETKGEPDVTSSEGNSAGPSETSASASPAKAVSDKVEILLKATGDAPIMEKRKWKLERTKTIGGVASFIKKYIKVDQNDSLFLYVNQAFAPALDVEVGTLFDCFGTDGKLVLHYCRTQAWG